MAESNDLKELGKKFNTFKITVHDFDEIYDPIFSSRRSSVKNLLEIGVLDGASLRTWKEYFPNAEILGADYDEESKIEEDRISWIQMNQKDQEQMRAFAAEHQGAFDIVMDDGCHSSDCQLMTLGALFSTVKPGGFYAIEDTHGFSTRRNKKIKPWTHDWLLPWIYQKAPLEAAFMSQKEADFFAKYKKNILAFGRPGHNLAIIERK
jgi:hypothetical protein